MKSGWLISFEGPDGAGKSTQIEKVEAFLKEQGIPFLRSREPGGTSIGEMLREILLDKNNSEMNARTEALLYAAARAQHVEQVIRPALMSGKTVICDRFTDSSIAYQGYGRGLGADTIQSINAFATGELQPDFTILLMLDPEEGMRRAGKDHKPDRLESENEAFHRVVYRGYRELAQQNPDRIIAVNANGNVEEIAAQIRTRMLAFLGGQK